MRDTVNCYGIDGETVEKQLEMPDVLRVPIRRDLVEDAFRCVRMDNRQPYAVSPIAGKQHSAHSWGTGRAMARVPRVSGSGTTRSGQGANANFCRKGRLAHPTKVIRRWQRKFNLNALRHAEAMALAATAIAPLVESRGHRIAGIKMIPLVVSNSIKDIKSTKEAFEMLKRFGLADELAKVKDSKSVRPGKGKMRNRRYVMKKGLLIIYDSQSDAQRAFRNIAGVDLACVDSLSLLDLCPGGHLGRLVMWTLGAFEKLNEIYGQFGKEAPLRSGYFLPTNVVSKDDVESLFYTDEVQAFLDVPNLIKYEKTSRRPEVIESLNPYLSLMEK